MTLLERLEAIYTRFKETEMLLSSPEITADMGRFRQLNREYAELQDIADIYHVYRNQLRNLEHARHILQTEKDRDLRDLAVEEIENGEQHIAELEEKIRLLLIPKDPQDGKNAIVEIRAGTGGDEACLFAGDFVAHVFTFL
jgi:peptide chain release factor 1